jgi:hypothetical protein
MFKEHVDELHYDHSSAEAIFEEMEGTNTLTTKIFRFLSWFMSVFGHYLLFTPLIRLFSMIPFVGWLLANVIAVAAVIFSFLWATMLHFLVMGVAWLFYRPLFGILLLAGFGLIFFAMTYSGGMKYD